MISKLLSWESWAYGAGRAFIQGGASAITAQAGLAGAQTVGINVHMMNWKELGSVFIGAAIYKFAVYLTEKPLPEITESTQPIPQNETDTQKS